MSEAVTKLQDAKVEPALRTFKSGAVGSIELLSTGFYGIIEAFQSEMEKSREIEDKMEKIMEDLTSVQTEVSECSSKCNNLKQMLTQEVSKIKKCLSEQMNEIDSKINGLKQSIKDECSALKTECMAAVDTISEKVGKSLGDVDKLKDDFENLEQDTNDKLTGLSMRCDENKDLIQEQDNKFKDQLNELTEILHNKALELDGKIESCLNETNEKIKEFDEKQQLFQFELNKELANKADIEDLKHKLDINQYDNFVEKIYGAFSSTMEDTVKTLESGLDEQQSKQGEMSMSVTRVQEEFDTLRSSLNTQLTDLQGKIDNPVDVDAIKLELGQKIFDEQANFREEIMQMLQQMGGGAGGGGSGPGPAPAFGTQNGNCIACGRGPNTFQPFMSKSPSPQKKPKVGGGFNRMSARTKSVDIAKRLRTSASQESLTDSFATNRSAANSGANTAKPDKRRKSTSYLGSSQKAKIALENNTRPALEDVSNTVNETE